MTPLQERKITEWLKTGVGYYHTSSRHWMRQYVLQDQDGLCAVCGCDQQHNTLPLVFVLDHISGDGTDHRRENLRMVCPNCDSQLATYKGRNKGRGTRPLR